MKNDIKFSKFVANQINDSIFGLDRLGSIIYANEPAFRNTRYSKKELLSLQIFDINPELSKKSWSNYWKKRKKIKSITFETRYRTKNKKYYPVEVSINFIRNNKKEYGYAVARDISNRLKVEKNLLESKKRYKELAGFLPQPIFEAKLNGILTFANQSALKTFGYDLKDLKKGISVFNLIIPKQRELAKKNLIKIIKKENKRVEPHEYLTFDKKGNHLPVRIYTDKIVKKGTAVGIRGVLIDITEEKKREHLLEKQKNRFNFFLDSAPFGIIITDKNHRAFYANQKFTKILGYRMEEVSTFNDWFRKIYPEKNYRKKVIELWKNSILTNKPRSATQPKTLSVICKNGRKKYINFIHVRLATREVLIAIQDITRQKITEEKLKEEKEKAQKYLNIAKVIIVAFNPKGEIILANNKACEILEYKKNELLGKNWFENFIPKNNKKENRIIFKKILSQKNKNDEYFENTILTKSGKEKFVAWHNTTMNNRNGKIISILSSGEDVTEQKETEKRLLDSYKHLGIMNRQIGILSDLNKEIFNRNFEEKTQEILISSNELFQSNASLLYRCHKKKMCSLISKIGLSKNQAGKISKLYPFSPKLEKSIRKKTGLVHGSFEEYEIKNIPGLRNFRYFSILPIAKGGRTEAFILSFFEKNKETLNQEIFGKIFSLEAYSILKKMKII
jgi:PAS domain S-box-containing protein